MELDWVKVLTVILTAILIIGTGLSVLSYRLQAKDIFVKLEQYEKNQRTVVIFSNLSTEEIILFFSQPFEVKQITNQYIALKFNKLEPLYKFYGISDTQLFYMLQNFKILDVSAEKGKDGTVYTFVLIELRGDAK